MNENMERFEAKLNLVDLAGSEGVKKTHAIGDRLAEANNINKGLLALGCCISGICAGKSHIPFRSSTLTKVLRGNFTKIFKQIYFQMVCNMYTYILLTLQNVFTETDIQIW